MTAPAANNNTRSNRWQRLTAGALRTFHAYANWLVGISWRRFAVLAVLLVVSVQILKSLPPFSWTVTETVEDTRPRTVVRAPRAPPTPPAPPVAPTLPSPGGDIQIQIDENGIRITPGSKAGTAASAALPAASAASPGSVASAPTRAASAADAAPSDEISITLPAGVDKEAVRQAVQDAREAIREAVEDQKQAAREAADAAREAAETAREAAKDGDVLIAGPGGKIRRVHLVQWGDFLTDLAMLWIAASAIVKATYKGRMQAEVKAAQAFETAEAESLKRQVVEARMAAMQAQVEPHFLFNTLASIDHLIEVDPPRASLMQKNLIALLRASMPTMREASGNGASGVRDLGRELAVIRPYLEILKVRMEERLTTQIDVPDGLLSAEFPPMMLQTLVENAIKHGLEPKADGGNLVVKAEILHGKLAMSVADTGLGFGKAATAGTGVGLANIRERLQLLYGNKASLTVAENQPSGTRVTVTVPYRPVEAAAT